ncbi:unnamed protein product [Parnassius mnemosyne]|uniref:THAP domain containing 9 n=1 Tax=Parnassius mnemosyne TaxID=213953 RepID=A0AAV1LJI8_9NEOP
MLKHLGCNFEEGKMKFEDPVTKYPIMALLDPSHMVKLIRNAFQVYQVFVDENGKKIKWSYLEELNKLQEKEKFHLANKLRYRHIHYHNQKMKVKLATQLFSLSVCDAIDFCREELNLPIFRESLPTTVFLNTINNFFDILNSKSMSQHGYKKPINENNAKEILEYIDKVAGYISNLKCDNGPLLIESQRKVGFKGFIGCAVAVRHFYETLVQTGELVFFPFYKTSQDHLELLFGNIRSHGGSNNNPTARQFKAAYKKLLVHIELKDFGSGNCNALEQLSILTCSAVDRINLTTPSTEKACDDESDNEFQEEMLDHYYLTDFSMQVIGNFFHTSFFKF